VLREAMLALLAEDQLPICRHVELAFRTFDDRGVVRCLLVELGRETRGPAVIAVSDGAVVDLDLHYEHTVLARTAAARPHHGAVVISGSTRVGPNCSKCFA
jgi:hypothetical protein